MRTYNSFDWVSNTVNTGSGNDSLPDGTEALPE